MNKDADSKPYLKFLDAWLLLNRIKPNPKILLAQMKLAKSALARYNLTRFEIKAFTFSSGAESLSIDNAVLGLVPKHLLFSMVKNTESLGSLNTNA